MAESSIVRGRVARFTKLDALGRPVYGPGAMAVTKGIIQVTYTPNSEEGEGISVTNMAGEQCVTAPAPCGSITNWTVAIQFCAVDPCVVLMMYPSWIPYYDDFGQIKGFQVVGGLVCDAGFALEVWGNAGSSGSSAVQCGPGATGGFRYLLAPRMVGAVPGEVTVANDATTFTFSGTTTTPVNWRRGPYLVDIVNGVPSVLRDPMVGNAQLLDIVTNVQPPPPTGGCVNLPRPIPEPASLIIDRDPANAGLNCVRVIIDNHGYGPVTVNWGDGTAAETYADCSVATHCYDTDGTYSICVADQQTPVINVCRDVVIPMPVDTPTLSVAADPGNDMCVIATVDMPPHSDGRVSVDWGDGTTASVATVEAGTPAELGHCYTTAGVYQIKATRVEQPVYTSTATVILPTQENPVISATVAGMVATLTVDNNGNGVTSVDWGDGTSSAGPATDGGTVNHTYAAAGTYTVTVTSVANPLARATTQVVIVASGAAITPDKTSVDSSGTETERTILVDGTGFAPNASGTVTLHPGEPGSGGTAVVTANVVTDAAGAFTDAVVLVPLGQGAEQYHLVAAVAGTTVDNTAITVIAGPAMDTPTGVTAGTATATTIPVSWTAVTTPVAAETYVVRWAPTGTTDWTQRAAVASASDTIDALTAESTYDIQVKAQATGHTDSDWSAVLTESTTA